MSIVKRKCYSELMEVNKKIYKEIKRMVVVLPEKFTMKDIILNYKKYYPFQFLWWEDMNKTFIRRNKNRLRNGKKKCYIEFSSFENFLYSLPGVKWLLSMSKNKRLPISTSSEKEKFINGRDNAIKKQKQKIEAYKSSLCENDIPFEVDPLCLEKMIKEYKNSDEKENIQIVNYLFKYIGDLTISLLQEIYETEKNVFIQRMIFTHLQSLNHYVRLSKKKKNASHFEYDPREESFDDLFLDINQSNSFERKKQFHFFISHNQKDIDMASKVRKSMNDKGYDCYFCWISDDKEGISDHLGSILELRIKQSLAVIKIESENHRNSNWCQYEIKKSIENKKQVFTYIVGEDINKFVDETILSFNTK